MPKLINRLLTKKQKNVLDFITSHSKKKGYAPSLKEIGSHFGLSSISTIHQYVKTLKNKGFLLKEDNRARGVSPIEKNTQIIEVSVIGTIAAGEPIEALENPTDTITITKEGLGKFGDYYALRVRGNSMINEGISDGDTVILRQQKVVDNGQTVVAIIDENQATLKKFYREDNRIRLQPANPIMLPIFREDVEVRGVVVKIIRNLEFQTSQPVSSQSKLNRRTDYSWDYRGEKTKPYTHGLHTYPAMFIPQIARRLIENYSNKGETVCDIFSGSGTALVESRLLGRNSYGIELNPLAVFLAKVKTTEISQSVLTKEYLNVLNRITRIKGSEIKRPNFTNIDFWFKDKVIVELAKIKRSIKEIHDEKVKNFFMASLSETVRLTSNTKNGEFKLVRIKPEKLDQFNPNVLSIFRKKAETNIKGMGDFFRDVDKRTRVKVIHGDTSNDSSIEENSVDLIVTSPPYGDSRTTVAYGQFSRLSSQWIDIFKDPNTAGKVDNELLGGQPTKDLEHSLKSEYLKDILSQIERIDGVRARDVLSFYIGLEKCLRQAYRIIKINKYFCVVVGNRLVKQIRIPTDFIIAELAESIGFLCEDIIVRSIPGKRMPTKNSPTNVVGVLEETMTKESILILRKTK